MKIQDLINCLETLAPRAYQEAYDNAGLLTGQPNQACSGALITLDCTEAVVEEALAKNCNLIIAHHPIIFKGLKRLTGNNYVERTIIKAIQHNIAIYAIHTNLDNVHTGVNKKIAEKLQLKNVRVLAPKTDTLSKLTFFVPHAHASAVTEAVHRAGAGQLGNYKNCGFTIDGTGMFTPQDKATPYVGNTGQPETVAEARIEMIVPSHLESRVIAALRQRHPYEEVAYFLHTLSNQNQEVGAGMMGELDEPMEPIDFLRRLKTNLLLPVIRHTPLLHKKVKKVAVCGGSGSFLLPKAIAAGADFFVTADFKYHEFFDADGRLTVADIGHYESEVFTKELLSEFLTENFPTFAVNFSTTITNPISYYL
jgi:dinuclear metal center YbgI/SA1388 family protein